MGDYHGEHPDSSTCWDHTVDQRIGLIADGLSSNDDIRKKLPGLRTLLNQYLSPEVTVEAPDFQKRLLRVFRDSEYDFAYQECLEKLTEDEKERVEKFVGDDKPLKEVSHDFDMCLSIGVREHLQHLVGTDCVQVSSAGVKVQTLGASSTAANGAAPAEVDVKGLSGRGALDWLKDKDGIFHAFLHKLKDLFTGHHEDHRVVVYKDAVFENWGKVVEYVPQYTCIPSSVAGVQRIVKYAKDHDMGVRCAGFRHSWAPIFGRSGQITISLLSLAEATKIPNFTALSKALPEWLLHKTELQTIEVLSGTPRVKGNTLVRVGVSTTNEQLRRWCVSNNKYTYPLNVIMVEMTVGGTNGPICHGAGRRNKTLSDLVRKVEYVDCHGKLQTVDDARLLQAAAGSFGLMGVITHLTLEFEPMTYALMKPEKIPVVRAIPPPADLRDDDIPPALRVAGLTAADRAADLARFERLATDSYYSEWFWFPYSDKCWVNCWDTTTDGTGAVDYPSDTQTFLMFLSQFAMNVLQNAAILDELIASLQLTEAAVTLISKAAMLVLPAWDQPVKTYLPDALHFQRGIQNVRVLDVEVEIPLQPAAPAVEEGGKLTAAIDYKVVQRAWWDAILACYRHSDTCPQRMPLEMRVMGGSDMIMAPQRGNELGTCAIEVLTLEAARDLWVPYAEEILASWLSYTDTAGQSLRTRPHWAKQWDGITVDGKPWANRMKNVDYKDARVEFKALLAEIGKKHGWTLADLKKRFSNDFFDDFYFDDI
ncbi:hypothetical protein B0T26DRAFT_745211 [Lasiosphaeria miniovina]|uniref:FAD-binding PCMH-type domain-containing protein n=1 Tax=Lasiosphaeria miniovina TaxID=1954250 RepID=A0AA40BF57_9PEZI|nr:uncharacterized protein B0T26DRAFT_745211 [Lasiosphaeria miniovina]KAK0733126.1 hypothetical protein B0T26DRAFT_745211 [Lasiosphaeria miniovina]